MVIGIKNSFNKYKKQGLTDTQAMKRAMDDQVKAIAKIRKADAAKRKAEKIGWVEKLKMGVTKQLAKKRHSKAGRKYLRNK